MEKLKGQLEKAVKVKKEQEAQIMDMEKKHDKLVSKHNNKSKLDISNSSYTKPSAKVAKIREKIEVCSRNLEISNKNLVSNNKMFKSKAMELESTKTSLRSTIVELNREIDRMLTESNNQKMNLTAMIRTANSQGHHKLAVLAAVSLTEKDLLMSPMRKNPSQRSLTLDRDHKSDKSNRIMSSDRSFTSKNNSPVKIEY